MNGKKLILVKVKRSDTVHIKLYHYKNNANHIFKFSDLIYLYIKFHINTYFQKNIRASIKNFSVKIKTLLTKIALNF